MSSEIENDIVRANNQLCEFSLNGQFLAVAYQTSLIIKDTKQFHTYETFVFSDIIEYIEWSRNSEYILCANIKKAIIQVYSIYYPNWKCKLAEGSAGLESVTWSPDSTHILTLSDFKIQLSIWSLEYRSMIHVQNLKTSPTRKLNFSPDGNKLALIISNEGEDSIEIYRTDIWQISKKLMCRKLNSIDGICWSPNGELLSIWSSYSNEPKLLIYSPCAETHIGVYCPGTEVNTSNEVHNYGRALKGIYNVTWMPSGQLLAVIGFNETIALLNHVTWTPMLLLNLDPVIRENNYLNKVYEERIIETNAPNKTTLCNKRILEEKSERPINIRIGKKNETDKLSIANIDIFEFSSCGQYIAIRHQLYPTTLWIWDIISDYVDYLLLENDIVAVKWNPTRTHLLIFCECTYMFEWTLHDAFCTPNSRDITVLDARWHPQGKFTLLCGYNKAIIHRIQDIY